MANNELEQLAPKFAKTWSRTSIYRFVKKDDTDQQFPNLAKNEIGRLFQKISKKYSGHFSGLQIMVWYENLQMLQNTYDMVLEFENYWNNDLKFLCANFEENKSRNTIFKINNYLNFQIMQKIMIPTYNVHILYRVFFFTDTPLKMSLDWHPPTFLSVGIVFTSLDTFFSSVF